MNKYYEYIRWSNESAHHPSQDYSFIIPDTIDKDTSFEIKYANRAVWANPFFNENNSGFWGNLNSSGVLTVNYFSESAQSNVSTGGVIKYDKNKYYFDGSLVKTCAEVSTSTSGIGINKSVYGDSANALDIYYIKVWQNDVLTRNLVPCLNDSNEKGFYDFVSETFFKDLKGTATLYNELNNVTASGTGGTATGTGYYSDGTSVTLTAVPNSGYAFNKWRLNIEGYTRVQYLQTSGIQFFSTNFKPNQDTRLHASICTLNFSNWVFGCRINYYTKAFAVSSNYNGDQTKILFNYNNRVSYPSQIFETENFIDLDFNKNELYKNGTLVTSLPYENFQAENNLYLFGIIESGAFKGTPSRWEWCKIYDNGTLIRDYIPVKRNADSVLGMLDLVEMKFYTNEGSGAFTAGEEISDEIIYTTNPLTFTVYSDLDFTMFFDRTTNCFIKVNGEWKEGMLYRKDTTWKETEVFVKNGTWKK